MVCKIYVDIGDIYTKFLVLQERKGERRELGRGTFPSFAVPYPPAHDFFEFEERIFYAGGDASGGYLVGWPGVMAGGPLGPEPAGSNPEEECLHAMLNKVLFENVEDGCDVEVYLAFDFGQKAHNIRQLAGGLNGKSVVLFSRYLYSDEKARKTLCIRSFPVAGPLCLFEHFRRTLFGEVHAKKGGHSMLIVDMGYSRTKIFVASSEGGMEYSMVCDAGVRAYYDEILAHFRQTGRRVNIFSVMKELELNFPYVTLDRQGYSVEHIIQNVKWDLSKGIMKSISEVLKGHYNRTGRWVDAMVITGGGAAMSGDLICACAAKENYAFSRVICDKSARYSVVRGAGFA